MPLKAAIATATLGIKSLTCRQANEIRRTRNNRTNGYLTTSTVLASRMYESLKNRPPLDRSQVPPHHKKPCDPHQMHIPFDQGHPKEIPHLTSILYAPPPATSVVRKYVQAHCP